jgi:NAD(P)-dependent dehydrogenase (short-subunit alcohol dehydrogenase family)
MQRLHGKVAIITGGAGGIGAATARRLAHEGARVVIADINEAGAKLVEREIGANALAVTFDAANSSSVEAMVNRAADHFGRLDILHNNAALFGEKLALDRTVLDTPLEIWDETFRINVRGYFLTCKFAVPHMIAAGGGAIINMASTAGLVGDGSLIAYGSSKAAIIGLTRYVATQHGVQKIRCNSICPGLIETPTVLEDPLGILKAVKRHILTPRLGTPDDIAALVAYLGSDEARYLTGENITMTGGSLSHQPHLVELRQGS